MSGAPRLAELADARLSRALDVMAALVRSLGEVERLPPRQRDAARAALAVLAEHGR
jgi:hypothetical protein